MQSAYIINDRTGKPYAVVGILAGGTEFYPIAESATSWASWMTQDFAAKKITKEQLSVTLDNSMSVEGPMLANRANKTKIDELIKKAKKVPKGESDKEETEQTEEKSLVPVLSLMDVRLDALENSDWRNAVNFKAKSLITDSNKSTFAYEVKRTRAAWDPGLAIPGTERRGGWRCPPGTRYGGQITDRFGRNCGWGVARRLANEISDLGERLENVGDQRRERRVNRRNERVARRLVEGGRVERAARAVGNALETGPERERRPGVVERAAGRLGDLLETTAPEKPKKPGRQRRGENNRGGLLERAAGRLAEALETDDSPAKPAPRRPRPKAPQARPARPRQPRAPREDRDMPELPKLPNFNPNDPVGNRQRYLAQKNRELEQQKREAKRNRPDGVSNKDWNDYKAHVDSLQHQFGYGGADRFVSVDSYEDWARKNNRKVPDAAPKPQAPRRPRPAPDNTSKTPVPAGAPKANETLEQYKTRKYNEHQARVRKIREEGGNAGFLRREEWEQFHGSAVEENWNRAQQRNGGRGARRAATDAGAARTATRRPKPADEPDAVQPARRQRLPFKPWGHQRGLANQEAAFKKLDRIQDEAMNANDFQVREPAVVKLNGKFYVVENAEDLQKALDAGGEKMRRGANGLPNPAPNPARPRPAAPRRPRPQAPQPARPRPQAPQAPQPARPRGGNVRPMNNSKDRHQKSLPLLAGPDGKIVRVPIGNKGINTKEDAVAYRGSLNDIPDDFLFAAMDARSDNLRGNPNLLSDVAVARTNPAALTAQDKAELLRIKQSGKDFIALRGQSITAPTFYLHIADDGSIDGRGYISKPQDPHAEGRGQHGELVGIEISRRVGFAQGMPRVVNRNNTAAFLLELGPNFAEGHAADYSGRNIADERSRMAHFAVNMLLASGDRHGRNGMYFPGNGALPIDFGRAFEQDSGVPTAARMASYVSRLHMDSSPLDGYKALVSNGSLTKEQAKRRLKEDLMEMAIAIQGMVDDGTYDSFESLIPNVASGNGHWLPVAQRKTKLEARIALLDSDAFINALWP